ncbi:hypothetical protein [Persephonella sp. KM09-Lau-8]|uniref:hypothetical protein n=1 Tax=Persephonella sp. KM09-Lau-8 TaxID=1158345 RepID=UPI00049658CF|nr:hypothetical protein [Persephonella sp. KM09-Lau-8]
MSKTPPPWNLTRKQYENILEIPFKEKSKEKLEIFKFYFENFLLTGMIDHYEWVREALIKGKNVPEKVISDYQNLKIKEKPAAIIWPEYKNFPKNIEVSTWIDKTTRKHPALINFLAKILEKAIVKIPDKPFSRIHIYITEEPNIQILPFQLNPPEEIKPYLLTTRKAIRETISGLKELEKKATKNAIKKMGVDPFKILEEIAKHYKN